MFSRNSSGRFSSFKSWLKELMFRTFMFLLFVSAILAGVAGFVYYGGDFDKRASAQTQVEKVTTFDEFFEEKVEAEMNRDGFKKEIETYSRLMAEKNVLNAFITNLEMKTD